jgi:GT2 family glycosyltransferase
VKKIVQTSVVIPTHRRNPGLSDLLEDLAKQDYPASDFEVIVVNSTEGDDVSHVLRNARSMGLDVSIALTKNVVAVKRNMGASVSRGQILVFLDDDMRVNRNFISGHVGAHYDPNVFVSGGIAFPREWISSSNYYRYKHSRHMNPDSFPERVEAVPAHRIASMNCSISVDAYSRVGGFDEAFVKYGGEDVELGFRLLREGISLIYAPDATALHCEVAVGARSYAHKIRTASRYSTPRLLTMAPEMAGTLSVRLTEDELKRKPLESLIFHLTNVLLKFGTLRLIIRLLEATDGRKVPLTALGYFLLTILATREGVQQRSGEGSGAPGFLPAL